MTARENAYCTCYFWRILLARIFLGRPLRWLALTGRLVRSATVTGIPAVTIRQRHSLHIYSNMHSLARRSAPSIRPTQIQHGYLGAHDPNCVYVNALGAKLGRSKEAPRSVDRTILPSLAPTYLDEFLSDWGMCRWHQIRWRLIFSMPEMRSRGLFEVAHKHGALAARRSAFVSFIRRHSSPTHVFCPDCYVSIGG